MNFYDLTQLREPDHDPHVTRAAADLRRTFVATVPDGWQQGPGAFGGLVLAFLVRGIERCVPDRPLRSLTAEIPSPVQVGDARIVVEVLRAGQSVTTVAARLLQRGQVQAHAVAVLGAARRLDGVVDRAALVPPAVAVWRDVPPLPLGLPGIPTFIQHLEMRPLDGLPFQGVAGDRASGWVRFRDPGPVRDAAHVVATVDAWWPAELARFTSPRPMVTVAFTMQLVGVPADLTDSPLLHTARTLAVHDGYVTEVRQLWTETGVLVALNEQTMVIVK